MSIINEMHKDLDGTNQVQPVLSGLATPNKKQKILLIAAIIFFVGCAIVLLTIILSSDDGGKKTSIQTLNAEQKLVSSTPSEEKKTEALQAKVVIEPQAEEIVVNNDVMHQIEEYDDTATEPLVIAVAPVSHNTLVKAKKTQPKTAKRRPPSPVTKPKEVTSTQSNSVTKPALKTKTIKPTKQAKSKQNSQNSTVNKKAETALPSGHLNIEPAKLTDLQIANIYLKEASKAQQKGDNSLAAEKWQKALNVKPDLNEVRKSLAMYYYSQNEADKTIHLLKQGALISPEYSDFNLILARIAIKNKEEQKAFLYLEQNPPEVEGNLDYYISHAILAQKFKMYERSEALYSSLLTQRPNNGRWLMSLAISQDRQGKQDKAITSYQEALNKVDLSTKAKDYINKRLAFLSKE